VNLKNADAGTAQADILGTINSPHYGTSVSNACIKHLFKFIVKICPSHDVGGKSWDRHASSTVQDVHSY
jgi:hypothetical protein